jgi:hypothetical protein
MTILSARKMVCDKLSDEFDTFLKPAEAAKRGIKDQINLVKSKLSLMEFSPAAEIDTAATGLENSVKAIIPEANAPDIGEITDFIKSCDFLNTNLMFKNPIALLKGGVASAIAQAGGFVDDLTDLLPEFDAGNLLGNLLNKFSGVGLGLPDALGLSGLIRSADKIINCIADRCGGDFATRVTDMTNTLDQLYTDLNLVSDPLDPNWGEFDIDKIYDDVALSAQERIQMTTVVESVQNSQTAVTDAINDTVNATKSAARSVEGLF